MATGTAGLEHSLYEERLWGQGWFSGSRDGFRAPNCIPVHTEVDHRNGHGVFMAVPGGRVRNTGQTRRVLGWV